MSYGSTFKIRLKRDLYFYFNRRKAIVIFSPIDIYDRRIKSYFKYTETFEIKGYFKYPVNPVPNRVKST